MEGPRDLKSKIYYVRDSKKSPVVTICVGRVNVNGTYGVPKVGDGYFYARGIAICSHKDFVKKQTGRAIASGRLTRAFARGTDGIGLPSRVRRDKKLKEFFVEELHSSHFCSTCDYNITPTEFEMKLLRDPPAKKTKTKKAIKKTKKPPLVLGVNRATNLGLTKAMAKSVAAREEDHKKRTWDSEARGF